MHYLPLRVAATASAAVYRAEQRIGPRIGTMAGFAYSIAKIAEYCMRTDLSPSDISLGQSLPLVIGTSAVFGFGGWLYRQVSDRHTRETHGSGETTRLEQIVQELHFRAERARFWNAYRS